MVAGGPGAGGGEGIESLHRTLLAWDFWDLSHRVAGGVPVTPGELATVPRAFRSVQVRRAPPPRPVRWPMVVAARREGLRCSEVAAASAGMFANLSHHKHCPTRAAPQQTESTACSRLNRAEQPVYNGMADPNTLALAVCDGPIGAVLDSLLLQEYEKIFEALVLEECAALLLRGNDDGRIMQPEPSAVVASKQVRQIVKMDLPHTEMQIAWPMTT